MKRCTETITPAKAKALLANNLDNRKKRESKIQQYSREMAAGRWVLTHQGIAIYEDGTVADGQNRLEASLRSNCSFITEITYGLPREQTQNGSTIVIRDAMDVGAPRSLGDQMHLGHGVPDANFAASVVRQVGSLIMHSTPPLSVPAAMEMYTLFGDIIADFRTVMHPQDARRFKLGYVAAPICIYWKSEPEKAFTFCNQLATYKNLSNPTRLFVKWFDAIRGGVRVSINRRTAVSPDAAMRILATCLMDFHSDDSSRRTLRLSDEGRKWLLELKPALTNRIHRLLRLPEGYYGRAKSEQEVA